MTIPPSDQICFALYSATHAMNRVYKPLLEALGLTYPQYLVLTALWTQDGPTVGQLGRQLMLETNTLTPLLKRMEAAGLIRRERSAEDERQVTLHLTGAGEEMKARAAHIPGCILQASALPLPDLIALHRQVTTLRDELLAAAQQKGEDG